MEMNHIIDPHASMCLSKLPQVNQQFSSFAPPDLLELTCEKCPQTHFFFLWIAIKYRKTHVTSSANVNFRVQIPCSKTNKVNWTAISKIFYMIIIDSLIFLGNTDRGNLERDGKEHKFQDSP